MNRRSYVLFLLFVWIALVYIIVAFTDATASSFHGLRMLENGENINGGGIATSSLMYLVLPIAMACYSASRNSRSTPPRRFSCRWSRCRSWPVNGSRSTSKVCSGCRRSPLKRRGTSCC